MASPAWSQPLGRCIGSGGFAAVWEIVEGGVLKVAHADHDLARARMAREAEALASITGGAVPRIFGHGVLGDGRAWLAMERIAGASLADVIRDGGVRVSHAIALARGVALALAQIHAAGWVHRDIKPDNIVRRPDGSIVILDLGLARKLPSDPDDPTRAGVQVGSLEYMAPEQMLDAASVDARADLYAFGCVLYELCAGRPPFVGDAAALERAHAALRPPPLGALASVPAALEQLCHDCLAKQPPRRPASAAEVAERLRDVGAEPSLARQHSMSMVGGGKQPVVMLWAELPRVDRTLLGTLAARKIVVVSQRGRRVLGGVVGADHADPASAAIAAARDLAAAGARVALHLDALLVANGAITGASDSWLPEGAWTGIVLTRALATVVQAPTKPCAHAGFVELAEAGDAAELFGRDALLTDLAADAAGALAGAGPALALLVGDPGVGKSTIASALVARLGELGARVHVGAIPPPGSGQPLPLEPLIGTHEGGVVRAVGDALRAAARAQPTAIILDDLHHADHDLLDAIEYATLGGEALPLWILGLATPRLDQRRPGFGTRAERSRRTTLPPLDEDAAIALTAALMRPAEYPPVRALRRIAAIAHGNPMHLATLVREIHDRGAIRTRPNGEHFLDTSVLDALPPIALGPWLAARELAPLASEVVALARICAVLGDPIDRGELGAVVEAVERGGGATTTIDVDVGLAELVANHILVRSADSHAFRQTLLEEGVYATTNEDERRAIHAAALAYTRDPVRIARHAEAVAEHAAAAAAYATVGEAALREHHLIDADQAWSGALRHLDAGDPARVRALLARGRARSQQQRLADARRDVGEAIELAAARGDRELEAVALLEQARTLDIDEQFAESRAASDRARTLAGDAVALDLELAAGRNAFRARQFADAVRILDGVVARATAADRGDILTTAELLLAPSLVDAEPQRAKTVFASVIERCTRDGDRFHLGAAYCNRAWLWSALGEVERTAEDLRDVIQIAREIGHAMLERVATYNLAEDRFWQGAYDEATRLARRSLALQRAHGEGSSRFDRLLLARILATRVANPNSAGARSVAEGQRGVSIERDELRALLAELAEEPIADDERIVIDVLQLVASDADAAAWESVLTVVDTLEVAQRLELSYIAARSGHLADPRRSFVVELAHKDPIWSRREF